MLPRSLPWLLLAVACLPGCGAGGQARERPASAPAPQAPDESASEGAMSTASEPAPSTLEEAEAALERARAELEAVALNEPSAPSSAGAPTPAPAPPAAQASRPRDLDDAKAEEARRDAPEAEKKKASPCDTACKAFSSLRRAREAVCRLDAPSGPRCARADGIVRDAGARVTSCRCPE